MPPSLTEHPVDVVCAMIRDDGMVLAAQRRDSMDLPLKWGFSGGKVETGESTECCILRQIYEELGVIVGIDFSLEPVVHSYQQNTIKLIPFVCRIRYEVLNAKGHQKLKWSLRAEIQDSIGVPRKDQLFTNT